VRLQDQSFTFGARLMWSRAAGLRFESGVAFTQIPAAAESILAQMFARDPARVLVVDDEPRLVEAMHLYLRHKGYEVETALNGEEALQKVQTHRPHVILLDIRMPKMDGLQVLRHVHQIDRDVGVIMITAVNDKEIRREVLAEGAADFIVKPVDLKYLDRSMRAVLGPVLL
jgi:CheY-like chemotaxis protein